MPSSVSTSRRTSLSIPGASPTLPRPLTLEPGPRQSRLSMVSAPSDKPKAGDLGLSVGQLLQRHLGAFEPDIAGDGHQIWP